MFYFKILRKETHRKPELVFNLWAQLLQPVFLGGASGKKMVRKLPANAGDIRVAGLIPGLERSAGEVIGTHCGIPGLPWWLNW